MARRYGRVGREDRGPADPLARLVRGDAGGDQLANPLQQGERGMPLVQVQQVVLDPERAQHLRAAEPEHDLLPQSQLEVADVEPRADPPAVRIILRDVGIHQVERDLSDCHLPDRHVDGGFHQGHADGDLPAVVAEHARDGRGVPIEGLVPVLLPAVVVQALVKVALRIHEPDGHQRDTQVAAFLEVVARQEAQTAGVERQRAVQAVLRREVGHGEAAVLGHEAEIAALRPVYVPPEFSHDLVVAAEIVGVPGGRVQDLVRQIAQHAIGIVTAALPGLAVQKLEQHAGAGVPAPPEVFGEVLETGDARREVGEQGS